MMGAVGDVGSEGLVCDGRVHDWSLPVVIVDLRDGNADVHRLCSRCGAEDIVPTDQEQRPG
jgi:hypothetical protein